MKGKIMIKKGNEFIAPIIVYVSHKSSVGDYWKVEELNTGTLLNANESDLIPFNYCEFKIMFYKWKIENTEVIKARFEKLLSEWN